MSGHSKWKNIAHKKGISDAKRAKVFTKIGREMAIAIKEGGHDPNVNSKLREVITKARANNVPNDNIKRLIEKYSGAGNDADKYEKITYEGYGPSGTAVIVETMTDNRNRTAAEMRHYFDKYGASLGTAGCVSWQFAPKGIIIVEAEGKDEDETMMLVLEAGADDFKAENEVYEISTPPENLSAVRDVLDEKGYNFLEAEEEMIPSTYITLSDDDDIKNMQKLLEMLEDNDDVQNVWHNCGNDEIEE